MKTVVKIVWCVVVLVSCVPLAMAEDKKAAVPKRILFVGNSYTSGARGSLMRMLKSSPYKKTVFEFITKGGAQLHQHIKNEKILERIKKGRWDVVVLQEQSQFPVLPSTEKSFHAAVDKFTKLIREAGAEPVLYMTWGRRDGDKQNKKLLPDYMTMQKKLWEAYESAAERNKIRVASVGRVWSMVHQKDKALWKSLYARDGSHPSVRGTYLVSCVFFKLLFEDIVESMPIKVKLQASDRKTIDDAVLGR